MHTNAIDSFADLLAAMRHSGGHCAGNAVFNEFVCLIDELEESFACRARLPTITRKKWLLVALHRADSYIRIMEDFAPRPDGGS